MFGWKHYVLTFGTPFASVFTSFHPTEAGGSVDKIRKTSWFKSEHSTSHASVLLGNVFGRTGVMTAQIWFFCRCLDVKSEPSQQHIPYLFTRWLETVGEGCSKAVISSLKHLYLTTWLQVSSKSIIFFCQRRCFQATPFTWVSIISFYAADLRQ